MNQQDDKAIPEKAARSASELVHDVFALAELQARLLVVDAKVSAQKITRPILWMLLGAIVGLNCIPIAFVAFAFFLSWATGIGYAAAFGWTFLAGLVIAGAMIGGGLWALRNRPRLFDRSRIEWNQNVIWLKNILRRVSHPRRYAQTPAPPPESRATTYTASRQN